MEQARFRRVQARGIVDEKRTAESFARLPDKVSWRELVRAAICPGAAARCDFPLGGPRSRRAGAGQSGQRSIMASAALWLARTIFLAAEAGMVERQRS